MIYHLWAASAHPRVADAIVVVRHLACCLVEEDATMTLIVCASLRLGGGRQLGKEKTCVTSTMLRSRRSHVIRCNGMRARKPKTLWFLLSWKYTGKRSGIESGPKCFFTTIERIYYDNSYEPFLKKKSEVWFKFNSKTCFFQQNLFFPSSYAKLSTYYLYLATKAIFEKQNENPVGLTLMWMEKIGIFGGGFAPWALSPKTSCWAQFNTLPITSNLSAISRAVDGVRGSSNVPPHRIYCLASADR